MEPNKPIVSIICAVRNDGRFIRETLQSVVAQTYPNLELIVMDGASTDNTLDIVKEFAAKHKNIIWRSEPDKGQWEGLEKALALATGKYVAQLCGQDGYLNPEWFARSVEVLETQPDISLVWGIPFNMSEDGKLIGPHYAYARYLKDASFGINTKPLTTIAAKINWRHPDAWRRLGRMMKKLTPRRAVMVLRSFRKEPIPQKEDWFAHWLATGQAFPEGNMVMRKEVYLGNTVRFPRETMTTAALLDFYFNFNTKGYLSYGLPLAASFSRQHAGGHLPFPVPQSQVLRDYDEMFTTQYQQQISDFRNEVKRRKMVHFINPAGVVVSTRTFNL